MRDHTPRHQTLTAAVTLAVALSVIVAVSPPRADAQTGPEAGTDTGPPPGLTYASATQDVMDDDPHHFVRNSRVQANVMQTTGTNNDPGTAELGWPGDVFLREDGAVEPLDWSQLILTDRVADSGTWSTGDWHIPLPDISVDGSAVVAAGTPERAEDIEATVRYEALDDASPVVRMELTLENTGSSDHAGFFQYLLDPDLGSDVTTVPGVGTNPGNVADGWASNWMASTTSAGEPATAIAWHADEPHTLHAAGFVMGAWWEVDVPAGGTDTVTWYHVTDTAGGPDLTGEVARWANAVDVLDPDVEARPRVAGRVADTDGVGVADVEVVIRDIDSDTAGIATTSADGTYEIPVEEGTYTLTATRLGYTTDSRSVEVDGSSDRFQVDLEMTPVSVSATTGKVVPGPRSEGSREDLVLENQHLAMTISQTTQDPQLDPATVGKPIDLAVTGVLDELDWLNLPWLSPTRPQGEDNWQVNTVVADSVDAVVAADVAEVTVEAAYTEDDDVRATTTFELRPDDAFVTATTTFRNAGAEDLTAWTGDVIDIDVADQSFLPGIGAITNAYGDPQIYTPSQPWMAMRGAEQAEYGLIYTDDLADELEVMGTVNYLSSQREVTVPAGGELTVRRRVVAVPTPEDAAPFETFTEAYQDHLSARTGLSFSAAVDDTRLGADATTTVRATLRNDGEDAVASTVTIDLPAFLGTSEERSRDLVVPAGEVDVAQWSVTSLGGGRGTIGVSASADGHVLGQQLRVSSDGPGWYWGDNHSHSTFSDGSGTIADNFASARNYGLSWLTATDHNTIDQAGDVEAQAREDFVALWGEEITSSDGHSLGYNIDELIDWRQPAQGRVDQTTASNDGQGMFFIAHPYYPGLEWDDYDLTGMTGIEVWNGFYPPRHAVNANAFAKWDELNTEGQRLIGIANSDAHNPGKVGSPHIRACLPQLDEQAIDEVMRSGYFYGSNGPDLRFTVGGQRMGGDLGVPAEGAMATVSMEGRAHEAIDEVRLVHNGQEVGTFAPDTSTWEDAVDLEVAPDDVVRLELETTDGRFAFSNPVWIVEGDGPIGGEPLDCTVTELTDDPADDGSGDDDSGTGGGSGDDGAEDEPTVDPVEGSERTVDLFEAAGGQDPTAVSVALSELHHPDGDPVFAQDRPDEALVASDLVFADALASGALQHDGRSLLLNAPDVLEEEVLSELRRLGVGSVRILGGTEAISPAVEDALDAEGFDVERTAGATRVETALRISELVGSSTALVARGYATDGGDGTQAFADSLAAGALAAAHDAGLVLTQTVELTPSTRSFLEGVDTATLIGGEDALSADVSQAVDDLVGSLDRLSGANRFATAVALAGARGFDADAPAERVILLEGQDDDAWAAGFAAAGLSASADAPILLVNGDDVPPESRAFLEQAVRPASDGTVVVCAASASACQAAEALLAD